MLDLIERLKEKGISKESDDELLIDIHHELMKFYHCWIPIEEFQEIPIPTLAGLLERIRQSKLKPEPVPVIILGFAKKGAIKRLG